LEPNHNIERFVACAFGLFLIGARRWDAKVAGLPVLRPLAACGLMSYSIYLAHPLVTKAISHGMYRAGYDGHWETLLVTTPLCVAASMLCATAFYWLVERHFVNGPQSNVAKKLEPVTIEAPAELAVAG
jgi:peptidoglycan/LPS O-acetylase OafA/YrhL